MPCVLKNDGKATYVLIRMRLWVGYVPAIFAVLLMLMVAEGAVCNAAHTQHCSRMARVTEVSKYLLFHT
jgi:hypothetical protein